MRDAARQEKRAWPHLHGKQQRFRQREELLAPVLCLVLRYNNATTAVCVIAVTIDQLATYCEGLHTMFDMRYMCVSSERANSQSLLHAVGRHM
jgi:hypothetical protein